MARRSSQKRTLSQILFIVLSIVVVLSMAVGYLLTALPPPPPPTPTPTHTPQVSWVVPIDLPS